MKIFSFKAITAMVLGAVASVAFAAQVSAMTPNLSVVSNNTNTVMVTVTADANAPVILDYYSGYQLVGAGIIGYTNYSGYFSTTLNTASYPTIPSGAQIIVMVNGQQSLPATWPTTYNQYPGNNYPGTVVTPILSQNNVSLTVGQSQSVTITNNSYNTYPNYFGNNYTYYITNPSTNIVNATVSGNTITLYGQANGSATVTVCSSAASNYGLNNYYNNNACASLFVTVTGSIYYPPTYPTYPTYPQYPTYPTYPTYPQYPTYPSQPVTVSNNNVQVTVGNTGTVLIYGNNGVYNPTYPTYPGTNSFYITNNNSGIANATINGNTVTIYGTSAGYTTVTICGTGGQQCATINVTVIAPTYYPGQNNNNDWYYSDIEHCWKHR